MTLNNFHSVTVVSKVTDDVWWLTVESINQSISQSQAVRLDVDRRARLEGGS